jgi:hypothetical protein
MMIDNKEVVVTGRFLKTAVLKDEWYDDVDYPETFVRKMRDAGLKADLFTFWQRLNQLGTRYDYHAEPDPAAVIPVKSYDHWLNHQIERSAKKAVSEKEG